MVCTIDTFGRVTTEPGSTPITRPIVSLRDRTAGNHVPHALIESFSHSSKNCMAYCRARLGTAPSEWLMRCTPLDSVGNSLRVARSSASLFMKCGTTAVMTSRQALKEGSDERQRTFR